MKRQLWAMGEGGGFATYGPGDTPNTPSEQVNLEKAAIGGQGVIPDQHAGVRTPRERRQRTARQPFAY